MLILLSINTVYRLSCLRFDEVLECEALLFGQRGLQFGGALLVALQYVAGRQRVPVVALGSVRTLPELRV